jgi:hypothetical protein
MLAALPQTGIYVNADAGGEPRRAGTGPAARCSATVGTVDVITAVDSSLGTTIILHSLIANWNANTIDATDPTKGLPITTASGVVIAFENLPAGAVFPANASFALIDSTHAWAKPTFIAFGKPIYPTQAQLDAEMEASRVVPVGVAIRQLGNNKIAVTLPDLEPYASAHVTIEFAVPPAAA